MRYHDKRKIKEAQEKLEKRGVDKWNLNQLSMETGKSRKTLRKIRDNGELDISCSEKITRAKRIDTQFTHYSQNIDELLIKGTGNAALIFRKIKKMGYGGSESSVFNYVSNNKDRLLTVKKKPKHINPPKRAKRYDMGLSECFHKDWGFINAVDNYFEIHRLSCLVLVCAHCSKSIH